MTTSKLFCAIRLIALGGAPRLWVASILPPDIRDEPVFKSNIYNDVRRVQYLITIAHTEKQRQQLDLIRRLLSGASYLGTQFTGLSLVEDFDKVDRSNPAPKAEIEVLEIQITQTAGEIVTRSVATTADGNKLCYFLDADDFAPCKENKVELCGLDSLSLFDLLRVTRDISTEMLHVQEAAVA